MCNWDSLQPYDKEVLEALAAQDQDRAFDIFLEGYQHKVVGYCAFKTGNQQDGEDIAQDVFVAIYNALPRYRGRGSICYWVSKIVKNQCRQHWRQCLKRQDIAEQHDREIHNMMMPEPPGTPEEIYDETRRNAQQIEEREHVRHCLTCLDEQDRILLLMRYYDNLSYRAIAKLLWMSEVTVRRKIKAAEKKAEVSPLWTR
ncbi:MAG: hypothetical protein ETSY2_45110 [Candidatus Entotheonella gemina]|uniref:Uncharacterized protein n=1 Tax=Candidatus Entotheonella gemina TaxID=1429439 RepID=W4LII5_9BACT|nr:MAG: hypothetical protein ETSY2_45110 [Candidatus Entotheonella gemina]